MFPFNPLPNAPLAQRVTLPSSAAPFCPVALILGFTPPLNTLALDPLVVTPGLVAVRAAAPELVVLTAAGGVAITAAGFLAFPPDPTVVQAPVGAEGWGMADLEARSA